MLNLQELFASNKTVHIVFRFIGLMNIKCTKNIKIYSIKTKLPEWVSLADFTVSHLGSNADF